MVPIYTVPWPPTVFRFSEPLNEGIFALLLTQPRKVRLGMFSDDMTSLTDWDSRRCRAWRFILIEYDACLRLRAIFVIVMWNAFFK